MSSDRLGSSLNYKRQEQGYRDRALKLYPWVCGRCARAFEYSNIRELTVHHMDHDHTNNPNDGSNWELLCIIIRKLKRVIPIKTLQHITRLQI